MTTLAEIKAAVEAATQGEWKWKGGIAPDWMPDTFMAVDDLRVETPTPDKPWDAEIAHVLQGTKSGFIMVRNADAELIANAPEYLRKLIAVAEAARALVADENKFNHTQVNCSICGGFWDLVDSKDNPFWNGEYHEEGCEYVALINALKALE